MSGILVISLDFEGLWGSVGSRDSQSFCNRVELINTYVPRLLDIFRKYEIHATWAIVGALLCSDNTEALSYIDKDIVYKRWNLSIKDYINNICIQDTTVKNCYFNPKMVSLVGKESNQEIAAHTFSHFYSLELGANDKLMEQELLATKKVMEREGYSIKSIVMPRNMVNPKYHGLLRKYGYTSIRGRQKMFIKSSSKDRNKLIDFIDAYLPIRRDLCYPISDIDIDDGIANVRASMFYRTYNKKLRLFENLKYYRIRKEMRHAAKHNMVFHLWWHPHNMASDMEKNFATLEKILNYYKKLKYQYGFTSMTMSDIANVRMMSQLGREENV